MEPIFKTSYLGSTVKVYPTHVEWGFLFKKQSVPINQIASVELGIPLYAQVVIETTGGKKLKIPVGIGEKNKLKDAIYSAQSGGGQRKDTPSEINDLEKLAELKEKGVITEEEFQQKKKQILGL